jgi:hypothetical protein
VPNLSQQAKACSDKVRQWVRPKPQDVGSSWLTQRCYGQGVSKRGQGSGVRGLAEILIDRDQGVVLRAGGAHNQNVYTRDIE